MYFNHRILEEARRKDVPVLERLCFLGIYSNNLDEFFRVRVANINRMVMYKPETHQPKKTEIVEIEKAKKLQKQILIIHNLKQKLKKQINLTAIIKHNNQITQMK